MQLSYRAYQVGDFSYCNSLMEENMGAYFEALGIKWDPNRYIRELAKGQAWIIFLENEKVGFVHTSEKEELPYVDSIQISAKFRQRGIGSSVLAWLEEQFQKESKTAIQLSVFKNSPALRLYKRLGYAVKADRGSKFLMQKSLS